jgi:hypothetical protein
MTSLMTKAQWAARRESQIKKERPWTASLGDALRSLARGQWNAGAKTQAMREAQNALNHEVLRVLDATKLLDNGSATAFASALGDIDFEFGAVDTMARVCLHVAEQGPAPAPPEPSDDPDQEDARRMCQEAVDHIDDPHPFLVTDSISGVIADMLNAMIHSRSVPWLARIEARAIGAQTLQAPRSSTSSRL